jgi:two-component system, chemotaxis family, sensor kinase CheA
MVGELVITQSMLGLLGDDFEMSRVERLKEGLAQLERHTRELQESVMQIRMVPISFSFSRFPRLVHDLSTKLGKQIELRMTGENTEVDKTVIEKIGDPLVHLVRNSLDHGIELPQERVAAGKPATGTVHLARHTVAATS